jgi:Zn-dependent peptidase ImmA (M78 family)
MSKHFTKLLIQQKAEKILKDMGITTLPVDPIAIAEKNRIVVSPKDDQFEGVSGMLVRVGDTIGIMYSTYYRNRGFENFSIAHELGHYYLEGHVDYLLGTAGFHSSHAGFFSSDLYEREADLFAAGFLMPEDIFKDQLWKYEKGLNGILEMAELCNTSITATAIRYAEITDTPLMIVISKAAHVEYCVLSERLRRLKNKEVPQHGWPVPRHTVTEILGKASERVLNRQKDSAAVDLADWIECSKSRDAVEEVIGLGRYGKVLTVITV